jgi:hypothetical protein
MKKKNKATEKSILEFFNNMDWKLLKKQRRALQVILESDVLPEKEREAMEGIQHLLEDMAFHAVDELGVSESTLLVTPKNLTEKKAQEWEEKDSERFEKEMVKFIKGVQERL